MRILGLDLGTRTLGLAISDLTETIASFYGTLRFEEGKYDMLLEALRPIVEKEKIEEFVLGLPKNMNNSMGESALRTLDFKEKLEDTFHLAVQMQDERLTTVEATSYLIVSDMSRKKRKNKIDGVAASIILQTYLDRKKEKEHGRKDDI